MAPPPPPPPPPGPAPPGPPPPMMASKSGALPDRKGLLGDIAKGKQLKKAVTNDRSAPTVGGGVVSAPSSGVRTGLGKPPSIPKAPNMGSLQDSSSNDAEAPASRPPQLSGLFSAGMPTLKKTNQSSRLASGEQESHRNYNSVPVPMPPTKAPAIPGEAKGLPPVAPTIRPPSSIATKSFAPPANLPPPPPTAPAPPLPKVTNRHATINSRVETVLVPPANAASTSSAINTPPRSSPPPRPTSNVPSLPPAPPPPLPSGAAPPSMLGMANGVSQQSMSRTQPGPSLPPIAPQAPITPPLLATNNSGLDGLHAALAKRNSQPEPDLQSSSSRGTLQPHTDIPAANTYSLKPQNVKRVDDSKYRFQPDNALPTIRPFTGCQKSYRSGRPMGTTVPLNYQSLR